MKKSFFDKPRNQIIILLVLAPIFIGVYIKARKQALDDKRYADAMESAAKVENERRAKEAHAALDAKAAREQEEYERLAPQAKARIEFGKTIEAAYKVNDRRISVHATGKNFDTLELSSALIAEGTHTLDAAREVMDPETVQMMKHLKFKRVAIKGTGFNEESEYFEAYSLE
jgi:hypothetical protein